MKYLKACILSLAILASQSFTGCTENASPSVPLNSSVIGNSSTENIVTLKYYTIGAFDSDIKVVNAALNNLLEKKINIHIEYNKLGWSDYGKKLANIINSGTDFDITFATGIDQGDYVGNAKKGVWLALDPYLETNGKEMYDIINPLLWEGVKINGKIYGVPTNKEVAVPEWWIYPKGLIDKYKIDISKYTTLEALEPLFRKIYQNEPQYIPMNLDQTSHNFFALENYEYLLNRNIPLMVQSTDNKLKVVNIYETALGRETLNTLRKYYEAGYINEDAAVKVGQGLEKNQKSFWIGSGAGLYANASWSKDLGYEVVSQQVSASIVTTESARGGIMVVNSHTKYPEACIQFLNCLNTDPEVRNLINFGIEGVHYDLTPQGQVEMKPNSGYVGVQYTQGNWFILNTLKGDPLNKWDEYKKFNDAATKSEALDFTPDISSPSVSLKLQAVSRVTEKYYSALMTGTVDPEIFLPHFLKELKDAGIDELKNIFQNQIEDWKANR